jgi:hypothetical protein
LENHLISFSSTQQPFAEVEQSILQERSQTVHVFVDNSDLATEKRDVLMKHVPSSHL